MSKNIRTPAVNFLFDAILSLKDREECYTFFEDICTVNELLSLSQRFEVASMLRAHRTYLEIAEKTGQEIRVTVPGHFQRGGGPCAYDRVLSTRFGTAAAKLIKEQNYGNMVALQNDSIVPVPLSQVAGKLKTVPKDCEEVMSAKELGITFGD